MQGILSVSEMSVEMFIQDSDVIWLTNKILLAITLRLDSTKARMEARSSQEGFLIIQVMSIYLFSVAIAEVESSGYILSILWIDFREMNMRVNILKPHSHSY